MAEENDQSGVEFHCYGAEVGLRGLISSVSCREAIQLPGIIKEVKFALDITKYLLGKISYFVRS